MKLEFEKLNNAPKLGEMIRIPHRRNSISGDSTNKRS